MSRLAETECSGKQPYPNYKAAELYLNKKRRIKGAKHRKLNIYRCLFCGAWHVGSHPATKQVKRVR